MLTAGHVAALAAVAEHVVVTPWRSLVVPGGAGAAPALGDAQNLCGRTVPAGQFTVPAAPSDSTCTCVQFTSVRLPLVEFEFDRSQRGAVETRTAVY